MKIRSAKIRFIVTSIALFSLLTSFYTLAFRTPKFASALATHIVISEIQDSGATSTDEFVELYNPTETDKDISGWKLTKKTPGGGTENDLVTSFPSNTVIKSHGFLLVAHTDYDGSVTEDITYSTESVADDNTVLLYDSTPTLVDKVGMGTATDKETLATVDPGAGKSVERKPGDAIPDGGNGEDTDNNSTDFALRNTPEPQNSTATVEIPATPTASPTTAITESPTINPSESVTPTEVVSPTVTVTVSVTPTEVISPTLTPTETLTPTTEPTAVPTEVPSITVTLMPTIHFTSVLNGGNEVPPVSSTASGSLDFFFDPNDNTFDLDAILTGIGINDLSGSHIHSGAVGAEGAIIVNLDSSAWSDEGDHLSRIITGMSFPADSIDELLAGNTYVNAHTTTNPDGEIRGQLVTVTPSPSITPTVAVSPTNEPSPTQIPSPTATVTPSVTPTEIPSPTLTPTEVPSPTVTPTELPSPTLAPTEVPSPTSVPSVTPTEVPSPTIEPTEIPSPTVTPIESLTPTLVPSPTTGPTETVTQAPTATITPTLTPIPTPTPTPSTPPGILIARFKFPRNEVTECRLTFKKVPILFSFLYLPEVSCVKK